MSNGNAALPLAVAQWLVAYAARPESHLARDENHVSRHAWKHRVPLIHSSTQQRGLAGRVLHGHSDVTRIASRWYPNRPECLSMRMRAERCAGPLRKRLCEINIRWLLTWIRAFFDAPVHSSSFFCFHFITTNHAWTNTDSALTSTSNDHDRSKAIHLANIRFISSMEGRPTLLQTTHQRRRALFAMSSTSAFPRSRVVRLPYAIPRCQSSQPSSRAANNYDNANANARRSRAQPMLTSGGCPSYECS